MATPPTPPDSDAGKSIQSVISSGVSGSTVTKDSTSSAVTGLTDTAALITTVCSQSAKLHEHEHGITFSIRGHPRIATLLTLFSVVEVVEVRAFIAQRAVYAASSTARYGSVVRFGPVPRGIATTNSGSGVVSYIPHLCDFMTTTTVAATSEVVWGKGGRPFPPGLQLDLRALETRHNYVEFLLANTNVVAQGAKSSKSGEALGPIELLVAQLSITVSCSGQNFGVVY